MARYIEALLQRHGVRCAARLLDDLASKTCEAVWQALLLEGDAWQAKFASHEVYSLVLSFATDEPGIENPCLMPTAGDLLYSLIPPGIIPRKEVREFANRVGVVDLAIFYGRDNLRFSPMRRLEPAN